MRYITKTELILEDKTFMLYSDEVASKKAITEEKTGKILTEKMLWRIIDKQIQKKVKNFKSVGGICMCKDNILCKHRKKYLAEALRG
jgi:hypothetical protein